MGKKIKSPYSNFEVHLYDDSTQSMRIESVVHIHEDKIETENDFHELAMAKKVFNESDGTIVYVYNLDMPSKVEAQKLKQLRRSVALMRIFDFDKEKPFDLFKLMPWLVIILLVLFK